MPAPRVTIPVELCDAVARFRREAKVGSSLTSKHVVRVLDAGELDSGVPYLVMELLEGSTLAELAKERGPLPVGEAVGYVLQAIHGVSEAHALGDRRCRALKWGAWRPSAP